MHRMVEKVARRHGRDLKSRARAVFSTTAGKASQSSRNGLEPMDALDRQTRYSTSRERERISNHRVSNLRAFASTE